MVDDRSKKLPPGFLDVLVLTTCFVSKVTIATQLAVDMTIALVENVQGLKRIIDS